MAADISEGFEIRNVLWFLVLIIYCNGFAVKQGKFNKIRENFFSFKTPFFHKTHSNAKPIQYIVSLKL